MAHHATFQSIVILKTEVVGGDSPYDEQYLILRVLWRGGEAQDDELVGTAWERDKAREIARQVRRGER